MNRIESPKPMSECLRIFIESLLCEADGNNVAENINLRPDKRRSLRHFGPEAVVAISGITAQPCPLLIQLDYSRFPGEQTCRIRKSIESL